jgi:hypothetical protein
MEESVLRHMYLIEGLSAKQIADKLGVAEAKIVYWLRKYEIPKRSLSEAIYRRVNPNGDPFSLKTDLSPDEEKLKAAGLMLWVTEGSLKDKAEVYTSNSNPNLIRLFVEFLLRICRVEKNKIKVRVLYYPNMDLTIDEVKMFWVNETGLPESQINLNTYQAVHNYRAKSKYGTATVGVNNIKLRALMEIWLNEMYNRLK